MSETQHCANCRFWRDIGVDENEDSRHGTCRRFPPVFTGSGKEQEGDWGHYNQSLTLHNDWCGEWKPEHASEPHELPSLLTLHQLTEMLDVSTNKIRHWIKAENLPVIFLPSNETRFDRAELAEWLDAFRYRQNGEQPSGQ